jgi:peroxiredoxin
MTTVTTEHTAHTPEVGEIAPDFEISDTTGARRRLSELVAQRPLVLIFYRGHW